MQRGAHVLQDAQVRKHLRFQRFSSNELTQCQAMWAPQGVFSARSKRDRLGRSRYTQGVPVRSQCRLTRW